MISTKQTLFATEKLERDLSVSASRQGFGALVQNYLDLHGSDMGVDRIDRVSLGDNVVREMHHRVEGTLPASLLDEFLKGTKFTDGLLPNTGSWKVEVIGGNLNITGPDYSDNIVRGAPPQSSLVISVGDHYALIKLTDLDSLAAHIDSRAKQGGDELGSRPEDGVRAIDRSGSQYKQFIDPDDQLLSTVATSPKMRNQVLKRREMNLEGIRISDCMERARKAVERGDAIHAVYKIGDRAFYREFSDGKSFDEFISEQARSGKYIGALDRPHWEPHKKQPAPSLRQRLKKFLNTVFDTVFLLED